MINNSTQNNKSKYAADKLLAQTMAPNSPRNKTYYDITILATHTHNK